MIRAILRAVLVVLMAGAAVGHETGRHKGHPTEGWVVSVSATTVVLDTEKERTPVTLTETTRVECGDTAIPRSEIRVGDHVSVFGTKLETGELIATEVVVHRPDDGGGAGAGGRHHEQ